MAEDTSSSMIRTRREDYGSSQTNLLALQMQRRENFRHETDHILRHVKCSHTHMFHKELTPSDVGKLNRLVIPKKFALKYFSYILEHQGLKEMMNDDMELEFYDEGMKAWKFRYCYWRSSQSFVFTRGWNRFVKEKKLKEKDIVTFYRCTVLRPADYDGHHHNVHEFFSIDVSRCSQRLEARNESNVLLQEEFGFHSRPSMTRKEERNLTYDNKGSLDSMSNTIVHEKGIRLFGVQIS